MSQELIHEDRNGASRRAVIRAGVGVGVGLAAWSGPTITSLGGTPAYAVGCTFIVRFDISGGCKNIDLGDDCDFAYHPLELNALPAGYSISNPFADGVCCGPDVSTTLTFPEGYTCVATIRFNAPSNCSGPLIDVLRYGPESDGSLDIIFDCLPTVPPANTQYQIFVTCNTTDAPPECLQ
jgi:hypothetical protein